MWADLDSQYRLQQEGGETGEDRKLGGAAWAMVIALVLSLTLGGVLGASPQARSAVNAWLWDAHESIEGTWVLTVRSAREYLDAPAGVDLLNVRGALIGVGFIALTALFAMRLFAHRA